MKKIIVAVLILGFVQISFAQDVSTGTVVDESTNTTVEWPDYGDWFLSESRPIIILEPSGRGFQVGWTSLYFDDKRNPTLAVIEYWVYQHGLAHRSLFEVFEVSRSSESIKLEAKPISWQVNMEDEWVEVNPNGPVFTYFSLDKDERILKILFSFTSLDIKNPPFEMTLELEVEEINKTPK